MAQSKKRSKEDKEDWDRLYQLVKKILGYDENQGLSRKMVLRLQGLRNGQFIANNNIDKTSNYSYKLILKAIALSQPSIAGKSFEDSEHKFNYLCKVAEDKLNGLYIDEKSQIQTEQKLQSVEVHNINKNNYIPKTESKNKKLENIW